MRISQFPSLLPRTTFFPIYVFLLFAINLLLARAGETEDLELRFVVKNCYNAFASTSKFDISGNSKPKSIEPYRKHFFTAVIDDSQEEVRMNKDKQREEEWSNDFVQHYG